MRLNRLLACLLLAIAVAVLARPAAAQMLVLTEDLYVTEVRPDKNKIGTADRLNVKTRSWVDVEGRTKVYRRIGGRNVLVSQGEMWRRLKRGQKIRVHGGGDWDLHIVAKKIWF